LSTTTPLRGLKSRPTDGTVHGSTQMKRRKFLQSTAAAGLSASPLGRALRADEPLTLTPQDYEGPYYPVGAPNHTNELIIGEPQAQVLTLRGQVVDVHGNPYKGALVDIWHTDPLGRYKHPRDSSAGKRWDSFLYWGEALVDDGGHFEFRTYIPGAYGRRPAHIHYKVWQRKKLRLTSQIYFKELGGTRGASRSPSLGDLQIVSLAPHGDGLKTYLQVVI